MCTAEALGGAEPSWASFCLSLQCSAANLCSLKDIQVTIVSQVMNQTCSCVLCGPGGVCIVDIVPGGTELEPQVKTGSWAGRTDLQ